MKSSFHHALLCLALIIPAVCAHAAPIAPGTSITGTIATPNQIDGYTFFAEEGDVISVSLADLDGTSRNVPGDLYPFVRIVGPDEVQLGSGRNTLVAFRHPVTAGKTGVHTLFVSNYEGTGTGRYALHLATAPGAQELGGLRNGRSVTGTLTLGDIDTYTFHAGAGENVSLSLADLDGGIPNVPGDLYPGLWIFGPDGTRLGAARNTKVAYRTRPVVTTGTHTVFVMNYEGTGTGDYELHFVRMPGANELGSVRSGDSIENTLTLGDIDSYTFHAEAGDTFGGSVTDLDGGPRNVPGDLYPAILFYAPDGSAVGSGRGTQVATRDNLRADSDGTYTLVVMNYEGTGTGRYVLDFNSTNTSTPTPVVTRAPAGDGTARRPVFSWQSQGVASWYQLWVEDVFGTLLYRHWYRDDALGCSAGSGHCNVIAPVTLSGTLRWWVQPWNAFSIGS